MIVENPRELRWKKLGAHAFLIAFIVVIMFPFLVVVSISLREGNFSTGSLLPDRPTLEHWYLAFGQSFTELLALLRVNLAADGEETVLE